MGISMFRMWIIVLSLVVGLAGCGGGGEKDLFRTAGLDALTVEAPPTATKDDFVPLLGTIADGYTVKVTSDRGAAGGVATILPSGTPGKNLWVFNLAGLALGPNAVAITASNGISPDITFRYLVNYVPFFEMRQSRFLGTINIGGKARDLRLSTAVSGGVVSGFYTMRTEAGVVSSGTITGTVSGLSVSIVLHSDTAGCSESFTLNGTAVTADRMVLAVTGIDCAGALVTGTATTDRYPATAGSNSLGVLGADLLGAIPGSIRVEVTSVDNYVFTGTVTITNALQNLTLTAQATGTVTAHGLPVSAQNPAISLVSGLDEPGMELALSNISGHFTSTDNITSGTVFVQLSKINNNFPLGYQGSLGLCVLVDGTVPVLLSAGTSQSLQSYLLQF